LWRQCTIEQREVLDERDVTDVLGARGVDAICAARLGEKVEGGVRIKGTSGRIEWLATLRGNGRYGKMGGRPRKRKTLKGSQKAPKSAQTETPPAPAPAPAPAQEERETRAGTHAVAPPETRALISTQPNQGIRLHETQFQPALFREYFDMVFQNHPDKAPAVRALAEWKAVVTDERTAQAVARGHQAWCKSGRWRDGIGIPSLANFLRERWFENVPAPADAPPPEADPRVVAAESLDRLRRLKGGAS